MSSLKLSKLVRSNVQSLQGYKVENFIDAIQLHANENPFPPSEELMILFQECLREIKLNRYPDPECKSLKEALAQRTGFPVKNMVIGNGSDELIQMILQIFCDYGDNVVFPDPAFGMYSIIAKGLGLNPRPYPLDNNWNFKADQIFTSLTKYKAKVIFFGYPNNPTGNCFSETEIQKVIDNFQGIVVVDEAYFDFSKKTLLNQIKDHNNLVVLRSLSKIGLAGLRIGYGIADPFIIKQLDKVRLPFNSNSISQSLAEKALQKFSTVEDQIGKIIEERQRLYQELFKIELLNVFPSDANFILFRLQQDATTVFNQLLERGVLVRDLSGHPQLNDCLRVTVGSPEENDWFLAQIRDLCGHIQVK